MEKTLTIGLRAKDLFLLNIRKERIGISLLKLEKYKPVPRSGDRQTHLRLPGQPEGIRV